MKTSRAAERPVAQSPKLLQLVAGVLDDKKAEEVRILDVRAQSSITDYLVLATGTSEPHLRALRLELEKVLDGANVPILGVEKEEGSGWTVFDAFEVMVHLFTAESRARYRLELLWKDALDVPMTKLLKRRVAGQTARSRGAPRRKSRPGQ